MTVEVVNLRLAIICGIKHVDSSGVVTANGQAQHLCWCRRCICFEIRAECAHLDCFTTVGEVAYFPELVVVDDIAVVGEGIEVVSVPTNEYSPTVLPV